MEKIRVRCRSCNRELEGQPGRAQSCGCSNMTTINGDSVTARDLSLVVMLNAGVSKENIDYLTTKADRMGHSIDSSSLSND